MLKNIGAVIFDLDGTLIDSMWIWDEIDKDYFKHLGIEIPINLKDEINHLSFKETAAYFKLNFNINDSIENILVQWNSMASHYYSNKVMLKDGALDLLRYLKNNNMKIALATSNSSTLLTLALKSTNIYDYFDSITTTDEVSKGKNHPDVYKLAADKLGIAYDRCLVFEDILEAIEGSKLANMKVCAVYDKYSDYNKEKIINSADYYIKDFRECLIESSI